MLINCLFVGNTNRPSNRDTSSTYGNGEGEGESYGLGGRAAGGEWQIVLAIPGTEHSGGGHSADAVAAHAHASSSFISGVRRAASTNPRYDNSQYNTPYTTDHTHNRPYSYSLP